MSSDIRVLHVDDDGGLRALTAHQLERRGFEVDTASGAAAALEALDETIDCVVSDFDMPDCDGLGLLEDVRRRDPTLPFILFTGKGSEEIASDAISAGVTDYLQKEPNADQYAVLANRIERAVSERRAQSALAESERMLSTLVSNLPGVVYRCRNEPDWPIAYIGGSVTELTGYERQAFVSGERDWRTVIHEADRRAVWDTIQEALEAGESFEITYRIITADGAVRWVRERGQGVFNGDDVVALEGFITDITAKRQHKRERQRYDRLLDAIGDPVYTTNPDGIITTFNDRAAALTGYDREEVVGEHVSILLSQEEIARGEAVVRELLREGNDATATYEITVRTADGDRLSLENHVALLLDGGEFRGSIGVLRPNETDVNTRLRELHEATRTLMAATDADAIAAQTTQAAKGILGQPIAVVRFRDGDELVLSSATDETFSLVGVQSAYPVDGTIAGETLREGEPRVEPNLGAFDTPSIPSPVHSAAYFPLGEHGVLIIASTETDAFDERDIQLAAILAANVEVTLDHAERRTALRDERDDFAALFENIPDPTAEVVLEGTKPIIRKVNPAFENVFGYTADEIVGESLDEYIVPPGKEAVAKRYNTEIKRGEGFHGEVRRHAADGLRDFILHVVPHRINEETTRGFAIYTDVTEQKARERELTRQNERLDEFASVVSHDLKNPLSVAQGSVELARETGDSTHLDAVETAHMRMAELIDRLLTLARRGERVAEQIPVDFASVAESAWRTVDTGRATLETAETASIDADPDSLRQLFENLFRNAIEHGTEDAAAAEAHDLTITVGTLDDGFYIEDDGVGISERERPSVFESGYSSSGGTGFGLAIVNGIADAHGWHVEITESEAGGARFEFREDESID